MGASSLTMAARGCPHDTPRYFATSSACPRTRFALIFRSQAGPGDLSDPLPTFVGASKNQNLVRLQSQPESRPFASADLQPSNEPQRRLFFLCLRPRLPSDAPRGVIPGLLKPGTRRIYPVGLTAQQLIHQPVCAYVCMYACMYVHAWTRFNPPGDRPVLQAVVNSRTLY